MPMIGSLYFVMQWNNDLDGWVDRRSDVRHLHHEAYIKNECADIDNDEDGFIDADDIGCESGLDDDEEDPIILQCGWT